MAKPKLALIPAAQGDKFYSVLPSSGVGDFDFTRSGGATRINSQGLIETVADGVSRLNYPLIDGKVVGCPSHLLEDASRNLVTYSENFINSSWSKLNSTITSNQEISPSGNLDADKFKESMGSSVKRLNTSVSIVLGESYTASVFVKSAERTNILLRNFNGTSDIDTYFDLTLGTITSGIGKIERFKNGWYRISKTFTATSSVTNSFIYQLLLVQSGTISSYQGDGTSGLYIWGAMLERNDFSTSYIPTNGSTVTRSAETATNSGDASTFNDSEGVLMAEISALANDGTYRAISVSSGSTSNRVLIYVNNTTNVLRPNLVGNGVAQINAYVNVPDITNFNKVLIRYSLNNIAFWVNGYKLSEVLSATSMPIGLNKLSFDNVGGGSERFFGNTKQIQYFDSALNDTELEKLTSWVSFSDMANGQLYTIE